MTQEGAQVAVTAFFHTHSFYHLNGFHPSIHPFSTSTYPEQGEPSSAHVWMQGGDIPNLSWGWHASTANNCTNYGQFKVSISPELHVLGLWEETEASGRNPHRPGENTVSLSSLKKDITGPPPCALHQPYLPWITFLCYCSWFLMEIVVIVKVIVHPKYMIWVWKMVVKSLLAKVPSA